MNKLQPPLKVVVLYSAGHMGSSLLLNRLIHMPHYEVVGVIKAQTINFSAQGRNKLKAHLQKVGWRFGWLLFWQRIIQGLGYLLTLLLPFLSQRLKPAWKIAKDNHIPVFHCGNINDPATVKYIAQLKPDLLISAYFSQILKTDVINVPRLGVINVHPGCLPAYKGAMAYFWVLAKGSDRAGVSVHWIDEGIDTGELIAQKSFLLKPGMTQQHVLVLTAVIGARLLQRVGFILQTGGRLTPDTSANNDTENYYPMPSEQDFDHYFAKHRFFRIRDVLGLMVGKRLRRH